MRSAWKRLRPSPALVVAILALVVALGGVAYATIPDGNGVIHGCYDRSGSLKLIDTGAGQSCPKGYTALSWNQSGPQGPAGANGVTHVVVRASAAIILLANTGFDVTANCNPGEIATGGGEHSLGQGNPGLVSIFRSQPTLNGAPDLASGATANGWRVDAVNNSPYDTELQAYVMCASP